MAKSGASIGTLAGTIIGGVIGAVFAVPTGGTSVWAGLTLGASIGGVVGGVAGMLYDTSTADDEVRKQQGLSDLAIQTSSLGQVIPQVFGAYGGIAGNVFWATHKVAHEHRQEESAGGKGGGPKVVTVTITYTASYAIGICDTRVSGPVSFLRTIYRDLTPYWYGAPGKALPEGWTFYSGDPGQMPDPTMEAQLGVGNVPAYRHLCYVVIKDDDLGFSGRTYNYTFDVAGSPAAGLAFGAMKVQPGTGTPWLNVRMSNDIWSINPATQETLTTTHVSDPEQLGGFTGTTDGQLAVGTERVWCTIGSWFYELDGTAGAVLSSHHFEEHVQGPVTFKDFPVTPVVERGDAALVLVQCYESFANFAQTFDTDIVRLARGGSVSTRRLENRRPTWLEPDPDGTLWAMAHTLDFSSGAQSQTLYHLNAASLASFSETTPVNSPIVTFHVAPDSRVWIPVYTEGRVQRCSTGGVPDASRDLAPYPFQATTDSDGQIWVLCQGTPPEQPTEPGHLFRLDPDSIDITLHVRVDATTLHFGLIFGGTTAYDAQLCPGEDGSVWVTSRVQHTVSRVSATGQMTTYRTAASPITVQPSATPGEVWVCALDGGLQRFGADGLIPPANPASTGGSLGQVVTALCGAAGLAPSQLDLADLPSATIEMALVSMQAVRAALQDLAQAYRFYVVESGPSLAFRQVGTGDIVAQIPEADLDGAEGVSPGDGLAIQRLDEQQLPTSLDLTYADPVQRYQSNTQRHMLGMRTDMVEAPRTVSVGLALSAPQARQLAQELLSSAHIQREAFQTTLSRKYAYLEPGDRVELTARGLTYPVVLSATTYGRPGLIEIQGLQDAAYVRGAVGSAPPVVVPAPPTVVPLPGTTALLLNLPALHGADVTPRAHVAFVAQGEGWSGATLLRSRDGTVYDPLLGSSLEAWTGRVGVTTPPADWHVLDTSTVITVAMRSPQMQLTSVSDEALYNGANRCLMGQEILAYGTATLVGVQTYALSRLLRGLRGTEHHVATHGAGETFLLLDHAVQPFTLALSEVQSPRWYKAVSIGQTPDQAPAITFTGTAANMYPWSVATLGAARQPNDDWVLTWYMRSRFAPEWMQRGTAGLPFDFDFRNFRVDIFSDASFTTVVRSTPTDGGNPMDGEALKQWVYSTTDQDIDFGAPITTLYYRIYQVTNAGLGFAYNLTAP